MPKIPQYAHQPNPVLSDVTAILRLLIYIHYHQAPNYFAVANGLHRINQCRIDQSGIQLSELAVAGLASAQSQVEGMIGNKK